MLKEFDDLDIFGVTFVSKMTSEKHLPSVYRTASQRFEILKSWRVFHDNFLRNAFGVLSCQFWSTGAGCTKVLEVALANGDRIHHDGCSGKL